MAYKVALKNNSTGEVRFSLSELQWEESDEYLWTDGNFGCDCNRALFFARAGGEAEPDERPCGDVAFTALYAQLEDGTRINLDD